MATFEEQRRFLAAQFQMLQGQLQQAQNTVEQTKAELAKILGKLELIAELEKQQDGERTTLIPDGFEVKR